MSKIKGGTWNLALYGDFDLQLPSWVCMVAVVGCSLLELTCHLTVTGAKA